MNDRSRAIFIALAVQLIVSIVFFPWDAPSEKDFYSGAKLALAMGVLANVVTRLLMMQWAPRTGAVRAPIDSVWYFVIGLVFALISTWVAAALADARLVEPSAASLGCVVLQQVVFATIAAHVQQRAAGSRISRAVTLLGIAGTASAFAVVVPSLLRQVELTDLLFAAPVILTALIGVARRPVR